MWMLEISLVHAVTRVAFADRDRAIAAQRKLQTLLGKDIYERNREESERTYTIEGDNETCVVVVQNVQACSVVDPLEFAKAQEAFVAYKDSRALQNYRQQCAIAAEYGLKS